MRQVDAEAQAVLAHLDLAGGQRADEGARELALAPLALDHRRDRDRSPAGGRGQQRGRPPAQAAVEGPRPSAVEAERHRGAVEVDVDRPAGASASP